MLAPRGAETAEREREREREREGGGKNSPMRSNYHASEHNSPISRAGVSGGTFTVQPRAESLGGADNG